MYDSQLGDILVMSAANGTYHFPSEISPVDLVHAD